MIPINFHTIVLRRKHSRTRRNDLRSAPGRSCFFFYLATGTGSVQVVSLASRTFEGRYHYSPSVTELGFHCFCWCPVKTRNRARQLCREESLSLSLSQSNHENSCIIFDSQIYCFLLTFILLLYKSFVCSK